MNRATFLKSLAIGAVAAPVIAADAIAAKEPPAVRRLGTKLLGVLPDDSGPVTAMIVHQERVFVACGKCVYYFDPETLA